MAIYYAQLLNKDSKKILSGSFSTNGLLLKNNNQLLHELRKMILSSSYAENKIYSANACSGKYVLYVHYSGLLILSCIADKQVALLKFSQFSKMLTDVYNENYKDQNIVHYEFDDKIKELLDMFNKSHQNNLCVEELENAHNIIVENLDSLINRGENINNLRDLAEKVSFETKEMSRKVGQIKRRNQLEKYKIYGVFVFILLVIMYIFIY